MTDIQKEMKRQQRYGLKVYVSQWGDTLSQLAQATKKDVMQLIDENDLEYEDRLNTGTVLKNLWSVKEEPDQEKAEAPENNEKGRPSEEEPASSKPQVRLLDQGAQTKQNLEPSRDQENEGGLTMSSNHAKESEKDMNDQSFLDIVNSERDHYGLVPLKTVDHNHAFLIRAFSDQSLIYSYQDPSGRVVTELAFLLKGQNKPLTEEEVFHLFSRQALFYQQMLQGLYRYQDFDLTYDKVNKTCQLYYVLLTETQTN